MSFPDAQSRRPDFLLEGNKKNIAVEIKATPSAAESSNAGKQIARDQIALRRGALLGKGNGPHVNVSDTTIKRGLPILGPGGNTALPGEVQRHVIIKPRIGSGLGEGVAEGTARSAAKVALRGAGRVAMPVAAAVDAYDLTTTYQHGGNTPEFRSKAAGVAGGWAGAAVGAEVGATIGSFVPIPVVGTVAGGLIGGAIGYWAGSGAASELEEGVEKAAPKVWDGAKSAWHSVFG